MPRTPVTTALCLLGILVATIVVAKLTKTVTEQFDNSGALMQLSADHVPTEEDVDDMRAYRRQVRSDLVDMTGSA